MTVHNHSAKAHPQRRPRITSRFIQPTFVSPIVLRTHPNCAIAPRRHVLFTACSTPSPKSVQTASRRSVLSLAALSIASWFLPRAASSRTNSPSSVYDIAPLKDGRPYELSYLRGKTTLFVNVASYCALTPQYEGLVTLHNTYQKSGFEIIASPCNQFGRQEPDENVDICAFAREKFGAKFVLLDKLAVNDGLPEGVAPLYRFLRDNSPERKGERLVWNFEKFLVGSDGQVLRRYKPGVLPEDLEPDVKFALAHPGQPLPPKKKPSLGVQ